MDEARAAGRWRLPALAVASVPAVGYLDFLTGYELSFSLFYLAPIAAAAWAGGTSPGLAVSLASALTWGVADVLSGHQYSNPAFYAWNTLIRLGFFVIVTSLIAALRASHAREATLARTDSLTGVANGRHFLELADAEVDRSQRTGRPVSLAYIDLDDFKQVNDRFGHAAGDALLQLVATTLTEQLRRMDVVARLGGDEFAVLLPETGPDAAKAVASKMHEALGRVMTERDFPVTASIGVLSCVTPPASRDDLIRGADHLMYRVKDRGKNAVVCETVGSPTG